MTEANQVSPADLRSYADDADQHGNRWVPIAPASLRELADKIDGIDRLRVALHEYCAAADSAWFELCSEAAKRGIEAMPILPRQAKAMDQYNDLRRILGDA